MYFLSHLTELSLVDNIIKYESRIRKTTTTPNNRPYNVFEL